MINPDNNVNGVGVLDTQPRTKIRSMLIVAAVLTCALAFLFNWFFHPQDVHASREGRISFAGNPAINDGLTCTTCHGLGEEDGTGLEDVQVTLEGPTSVSSGETVRYTAVISGGPAVVGGIGVSVGNIEGTLIAIENNLQVLSGELTHRLPQAYSGDGTLSFAFDWTAPESATTLTMYAASVSGNNSNDPLGDMVGNSSLEITVGGPAETPMPTATPTPMVAPASSVILDDIASGLTNPVDIQSAGGPRLFVVEQPGRIRIVDETGTLLAQPFLDIDEVVDDSGNEMGLLGLAFHPDYANNGQFFVNYTVGDPRRTRISRFEVSSEPNRANVESETILMEFTQPNSNHNGGKLAFGPDGYLYISTGDGGGGGDPDRTGQDNSQLLGKILRIDVDQSGGTAPDCRGNTVQADHYTVPADNPIVDGSNAAGSGNCDEIWATGLRNPWRFSFDAVTGDMWIGDVGQNDYEEIDFQPASSSGGENYGWRCYEADIVYSEDQYYEDTCEDASQYVFPVYHYGRNRGCSVTGGIVYRGSGYPGLYGQYIFADFCTASLWSLRGDAPTEDLAFTELIISEGSLSSPTAFGEDYQGELYVASRGGTIYQIKTNAPAPATATPTATSVITTTPTLTPTPLMTSDPGETVTPNPATGTPEPQETVSPTPEPSPTGGSMVIPTPATLSADQVVGAPGSEIIFTAQNLAISATAQLLVNGVEIGSVTTDETGMAKFILDTELLSDGAYVVRLLTEDDSVSVRIQLNSSAPTYTAEGSSLQLVQALSTIQPANEAMLPMIISPE